MQQIDSFYIGNRFRYYLAFNYLFIMVEFTKMYRQQKLWHYSLNVTVWADGDLAFLTTIQCLEYMGYFNIIYWLPKVNIHAKHVFCINKIKD